MSLEDIIPLTAISFGSFYLLGISIQEINKMLSCNTEQHGLNNFLFGLFINGFMLGLTTCSCLSLMSKKYH